MPREEQVVLRFLDMAWDEDINHRSTLEKVMHCWELIIEFLILANMQAMQATVSFLQIKQKYCHRFKLQHEGA